MQRVLVALLAISALVVAAIAVFVTTFDVNRYKDGIVGLVTQETGRKFELAGNLKLEASLQPAIAADGVRLGNASWDPRNDMLTIKRFRARVALLPLLHGRLVIRKLELDGADILLERNERGIGNWVLESDRGSSPATGHSMLPLPEVEEVTVDNAMVRYRSAPAGAERVIAVKHLVATAPGTADPIALELSAVYDRWTAELKGRIAPLSTFVADKPYRIDLAGTIAGVDLSVNGEIGKPAGFEDIKAGVSLKAGSLAAFGGLIGQALPPLKPAVLAATVIPLRADRYRLSGLKAIIGRSELGGDAAVDLAGAVPQVTATIGSSSLDLAELLPPAASRENDKRLFPSEPLKIGALALLDGRIEFDIDRLRTRRIEMTGVKGVASLHGGRLVLDPLHAGIAGGRLEGRVSIAPAGGKGVILDTVLHVKGLLPGKLPKFADKHLIDGGPTDVDTTIRGEGSSIAAIMGTANGRFVMKMGPGRLDSRAASIAGTDVLDSLQLLNPLSQHEANTRIECAVANFDIRNGMAATRTGIALQTDQLNVLGGGTIDLRTEALDIAAKPKPRQGIGVNLAGLSDFVHLGGTLGDPKPVADAAGAATTGAKVGLAFATGGLSLLAQGLFDRAAGDEDVCAIALGTKPLPKAAKQGSGSQSVIEKTTDTTKSAVEGVGNAVKNMFQGLFGK